MLDNSNLPILAGPTYNKGWIESPVNIYSFEDYRSYLEWIRCNYPGAKRPISLERWAKKLGYKSPRSIAMVLKGQRMPPEEMVLAFAVDLKLTENERRYLELLILKEKYADKELRLKPIMAELVRLNPNPAKRKPLTTEIFSYVSEWYCLPIRQLIKSGKFKDDPEWFSKRLRGKVSAAEVSNAIDNMIKLGVLARENGELVYKDESDVITPADIPSAAVRKHFRQQMERAGDALEEQGLQEREFTGLTLRVSRERLDEAKAFIREFRDQFAKQFEEANSAEVVQLNIQLFFHTEHNNE